MCGIFGQINNKYDKFDYREFCTLGVVNDVRGGDSVGIFIDGKTHYGIDKMKHFENFMCASKLLDRTEMCRIAFGHCRKTSVGVTSLETAQPVVIRKKKKVEYVLMHNGTIYNTDALAKKYIPKIDIKGMSDSQVMAHIFHAGHYEALKEYNGSAVFAIIDYRESDTNPLILFFKGESKKYEYGKVTDEERPLYFTCNKDTMFFSSIYSILEPIFKNEEVYTFETNILYQYENGEIYKYGEYDRSECCQQKITEPATSPLAIRDRDDYEYERYNAYGASGYSSASLSDYIYPEPYNKEFPQFSAFADIPKLKVYNEVTANKDLLYYQSARYNVLQGGVHISGAGYVNREADTINHQYWFWQGTMLKNKKCFDLLLRTQEIINCDESDLLVSYPELIACLSALPVYDNLIDMYEDGSTGDFYTGTIEVPFSKIRLCITNGKCLSYGYDLMSHSGENAIKKFEDYDPCKDDIVLTIVGDKFKE